MRQRAACAILSWTSAARISSGRIFRAIGKSDRVRAEMTGAAVLTIVRRAAGGGLEEIQMLLGHASLQTTERYLGSRQEIETAGNDHLGIRLTAKMRRRRAPRPATRETHRAEQ